jgi:hypothetical protein
MAIQRRLRTRFRKNKRLYIVSTEGSETEPTYFGQFKPNREARFRLKIVGNPNNKSAPKDVVQRLLEFERRERPGPNTEYWAVIDRDAWEESAINDAYEIISSRKNYYLALSNPCFELWLYLHLRDNRPFTGREDCQRALKGIWSEYEKSGYDTAYLAGGVSDAVRRAKSLAEEVPTEEPWPMRQGTHVYKLIEKLF